MGLSLEAAKSFRLGKPGALSDRAPVLPSLIVVVVAVVIPVGVIPVHWLNGSQNIGPTDIVVMCKIIQIPQILCGGASTSPPNPTGIGGGVEDHQLFPSNVRLPPALSLEAGRQVLDGCGGLALRVGSC
jgi:hypothetical protein